MARYRRVEILRNGKSIEICALTPDDRRALLTAIDRTSAQTLYRRFFSPRRALTEAEIGYFVDVDFVDHVALVAKTEEEDGRSVIVGGARFIVIKPGTAELAIAVIDQYQGQGIGLALVKNLVRIAQGIGMRQLSADVLAENLGMLRVFDKCGLPLTRTREGGVVHVTIDLSNGLGSSIRS